MDSTKFSAALAARIDGILDAALTEQRIVGAVFLVAREGSLVCERAVGQAERETQRPMRTDTLFRLSSITKPYVSAAALSLVARGRLSLEDRVEKVSRDCRSPRICGVSRVCRYCASPARRGSTRLRSTCSAP